MSDHDIEQLCAAYRETVEEPPYDQADAALLRIAERRTHRPTQRLTYGIAATLLAVVGLAAGVRSLVVDSRRSIIEGRTVVLRETQNSREAQTSKVRSAPLDDYLSEAVLSSDSGRHDPRQRGVGFLRQTAALSSPQASPTCGPAAAVDLNASGALARLKVGNPADYAKIMRIIAGVTRHPELDVARWLSATFHATNVSYLPLWMTSLPPKRRLSLCLAATDYTVVLTITGDGARVSPALPAPRVP